jgi:hypothetical protein
MVADTSGTGRYPGHMNTQVGLRSRVDDEDAETWGKTMNERLRDTDLLCAQEEQTQDYCVSAFPVAAAASHKVGTAPI